MISITLSYTDYTDRNDTARLGNDLRRRRCKERTPLSANQVCLCFLPHLVSCPINNVAFVRQLPDQFAVFQGASEAPISELIRVERATRKNSKLATARRVAMRMGRPPRCSSVTYRSRYAPSSRPAAAGPTAHFDRNESLVIYGTGH
jgi:hypothetical protein